MFIVKWIDSYMGGRLFQRAFETEREARGFINDRADGSCEFLLFDPRGYVVVRSAFPVLMVA